MLTTSGCLSPHWPSWQSASWQTSSGAMATCHAAWPRTPGKSDAAPNGQTESPKLLSCHAASLLLAACLIATAGQEAVSPRLDRGRLGQGSFGRRSCIATLVHHADRAGGSGAKDADSRVLRYDVWKLTCRSVPERFMARRPSPVGPGWDVLIKWANLGHEHATWEVRCFCPLPSYPLAAAQPCDAAHWDPPQVLIPDMRIHDSVIARCWAPWLSHWDQGAWRADT